MILPVTLVLPVRTLLVCISEVSGQTGASSVPPVIKTSVLPSGGVVNSTVNSMNVYRVVVRLYSEHPHHGPPQIEKCVRIIHKNKLCLSGITKKSKNAVFIMAWRCSGLTNKALVDNLRKAGIIKSKEVHEAMLKVDRAAYCVKGEQSPYHDSPQPIGYGATISAPHMHAMCLEELKNNLKPGCKALDVGSGSGYLLACMAHMVGEKGHVTGVEHIKELTEWSKQNLSRDPLAKDLKNVEAHTGDGRQGWPKGGPYDAIHVGAAAPEVPRALLEQLTVGGRCVVPVGTNDQSLYTFVRTAKDKWEKNNVCGVRYVPLTSEKSQRSAF
eukprot:g77480.t1